MKLSHGVAMALALACGPTGSQWAQQRSSPPSELGESPTTFTPREDEKPARSPVLSTQIARRSPPFGAEHSPVAPQADSSSASEEEPEHAFSRSNSSSAPTASANSSGRALGVFRNTYYNFPSARDHGGPPVQVYDKSCKAIAQVPEQFHDTLCVQGSGQLATGQTVSFARRNCQCARTCPRTDQKICFEALDPKKFPWGRGARGTAIVPLFTLAVDSQILPLGTPVFIPDFVGLPLTENGEETHDGCFVAADRGIRVKGKHVDVFTGSEAMTRLYNRRLPSNRGVTVYVDSPLCASGE